MPKIAVITGSRADLNPLTPVIAALGDNCIALHLTGEREILDTLKSIEPDMVLLLGDRYETLTAAHVAAYLQIPIAHIHGGETTEGSVDDKYRYAISMLSNYHFVCHEKYKRRLEGLGLNHIYVCGAPGVDLLVDLKPRPEEMPYALVCIHPEIAETDLREVWKHFEGYDKIVIAGANNDPKGDEINAFWISTAKIDDRIIYHPSWSGKDWLSLMQNAYVLIGNSSGFIFEGMSLGKKVIMVGNRQRGRYEDALEFFKTEQYPYGKPGMVSTLIAEKLLELV
jgi:GDP/UDP-N,N'-diacetylbacillosamine 2-epimerase (hydrolysing)